MGTTGGTGKILAPGDVMSGEMDADDARINGKNGLIAVKDGAVELLILELLIRALL